MTLIVRFSETDADRPAKEQALAALDDSQLTIALAQTRRAAALARSQAAMDDLFDLVRGMKTIHRLAQMRGLILKPPRNVAGP